MAHPLQKVNFLRQNFEKIILFRKHMVVRQPRSLFHQGGGECGSFEIVTFEDVFTYTKVIYWGGGGGRGITLTKTLTKTCHV